MSRVVKHKKKSCLANAALIYTNNLLAHTNIANSYKRVRERYLESKIKVVTLTFTSLDSVCGG